MNIIFWEKLTFRMSLPFLLWPINRRWGPGIITTQRVVKPWKSSFSGGYDERCAMTGDFCTWWLAKGTLHRKLASTHGAVTPLPEKGLLQGVTTLCILHDTDHSSYFSSNECVENQEQQSFSPVLWFIPDICITEITFLIYRSPHFNLVPPLTSCPHIYRGEETSYECGKTLALFNFSSVQPIKVFRKRERVDSFPNMSDISPSLPINQFPTRSQSRIRRTPNDSPLPCLSPSTFLAALSNWC